MAWNRRPGGVYYYRNVRVGDRIETRYFGNGQPAGLAADLDARARMGREREREALEAERARLGPPEAAMAALESECRLLTEATLLAAGFHQHSHTWRKRRVRSDRG